MTIENLEYDALLEKFKKILRENGLKYTQQREVLLKRFTTTTSISLPRGFIFSSKRLIRS